MKPNIFQVLQKQMDLELELFGDLKDKSGNSSALGKVYMLSLSSQPVDHEDASGERQKVSTYIIYSTTCDFHNFGLIFTGQCTVCLKG